MDSTPKMQRKSSLSLSTRLNKKRHSASPQNLVRLSSTGNSVNGRDINANTTDVPRSPSMHSVCSDIGIECTPPQKKTMGFGDESADGDYSPRVFDSSFSPSCFLSQTMAVDSPEVGWKWKRHMDFVGDEQNTKTPDSAYAADSSFTSAGSSSTEMTTARARSDNYLKRKANDARKEQELRRVQKSRADEKLKERCAKLQEQLLGAGAPKTTKTQKSRMQQRAQTATSLLSSTAMDIDFISQSTSSTLKLDSPMKQKEAAAMKVTVCDDTLNDFFNDSDADCFLLAATQEIESKIKTPPSIGSTSTKASISTDNKSKAAVSPDQCTPVTKEKRSSFYMKFLEDDCSDDWFISLDEIVLQATQSKKPRTSLQRYKSMPTKGNDLNSHLETENNKTTFSDPLLNESTDLFIESASPLSLNRSKIKRHSSSHVLSPSGENYHDRQNRLKK